MEENMLLMLESMKPDLICFICKEVFVKPVKYQRCYHIFCQTCVSKIKNKEMCPQCGLCNGDSIVDDSIVGRIIEFWFNTCKKLGVHKDDTTKMSMKKTAYDNLNTKSKKPKFAKPPKKSGTRATKKTIQKKKKVLDISISKTELSLNKSVNSAEDDSLEYNTSHNDNWNQEIINITKPSTSGLNNSTADKLNSSLAGNEKNIQKRNKKGETPLHIACVKGNVEKLKFLLTLGAKVNTKDNAGWTPLQEAADKGFEEIVKILLENKVTPDMPGYDHSTPLHMAVYNNHLNIAKMLLEHGCNKYARNIHNETPESLCSSDEMRDLLNNTSITSPLISLSQQIVLDDDGPSKIVIYSPDLPKTKVEKLARIINSPGSNMIRSFKMDQKITHVLVNTDLELLGKLSVSLLLGLLSGKWIISDQWIDASNPNDGIEKFEIKGTISYPHSYSAKRARISHINQLPGLFNGCHFYFWGPATDAKVGDLMISRYHLTLFVEYGGGVVLKREPNPESIPESEKISPYHVKSTSSLKKCSHYIIYRTDIPEPILKYNMPHIKSLPLQWMINCIETFKIMEPCSM